MPEYLFPDDFLWGVATASYQIEGSPTADGKGESIWDRFSHKPGNIFNGETGDIACDHYIRYEEDLKMMAEMDLGAYRFSLSWPRIFPDGNGKFNEPGLDFYRRLGDQLHRKNINPVITLYHWDLPQLLQDRGGWQNRDTVKYFADYAAVVYDKLDIPVEMWITLNEPWVITFLGHAFGIHAPGVKDFNSTLQVAHNLLLAHGLAVGAFRRGGREGEKIGITLDLSPCHPAGDNQADRAAAVRTDGYKNRWFLDPILKGSYPSDLQDIFSQTIELPSMEEEDLKIISTPIDFLGVNNYTRMIVESTGSENDFMGSPLTPVDSEYTEMGWEVYPQGLYELLIRIHHDYGPIPLYITENGAAFPDILNSNNTVDDSRRINYLRSYLQGIRQAISEGVPVKGYFVWTLMDNFEWSYGFSKRFGLIYVDHVTQKRYWKNSAHWYKNVIRQNGFIE